MLYQTNPRDPHAQTRNVPYHIVTTISYYCDEQARLNYESRETLNSIAASVENVALDFMADVALYPELFESGVN